MSFFGMKQDEIIDKETILRLLKNNEFKKNMAYVGCKTRGARP